LNRWYDVSAYRIGGSESRKVAILFNDITEAKRATDALRESESRERARAAEVEAIMDAAPAAIFIAHDAECRSMSGNRTAHTLLQREPGKNLSKSASEGERPANFRAMKDGIEIPPQELPVQKAAATGQPVRNYELDVVFEDGATLNLLADAVPMLDEDGRPRGAVGILSDITELKRAERRLRESQKLESLGLLAGGVAHDFNNLLTLINCYAEFIVNGLPKNDPLRKDASQIQRAGERAAALTGQLLAFSRKQVIQPRPLNLNAIIAETEDMLRRLVGEDIELMVSLNPRLGQVLADPGQMHQILMNLAANARDAMPDGGELFIETSNVEIDGKFAAQHPETAPGPYVLLTVTDTGQGMDQATAMQIFEPFFTTKGLGSGTRLGLATVYGIVRQNSGWIGVQSEPGKGASFQIYLPRISAVPSPEPLRESAPATLTGGETVLIVEDQKEVLQLARTTLESYGYRVLEAAHAEEAILVSGGYPGPIDILVTDVVLPGMNGRELAGRLIASRPAMKVLFVSGYAGDVIAHRGVLDSGLEYLPKPFSPDGLAAKIREVLGPPRPLPC
jgi:signal transduction histidine kinase/CheY-like chemotaxis protein